jgi:hypothetical protein
LHQPVSGMPVVCQQPFDRFSKLASARIHVRASGEGFICMPPLRGPEGASSRELSGFQSVASALGIPPIACQIARAVTESVGRYVLRQKLLSADERT